MEEFLLDSEEISYEFLFGSEIDHLSYYNMEIALDFVLTILYLQVRMKIKLR